MASQCRCLQDIPTGQFYSSQQTLYILRGCDWCRPRVSGVLHLLPCVSLCLDLLSGSEVFISPQRSSSADTASASEARRSWRRRRSTCPQLHSSLSCPAWPLTPQGWLPASVGFMFPAIVVLPCLHLDAAKGPGLSSKAGVSGGQPRGRGPSCGRARPRVTPPSVSATSWVPIETRRGGDKNEESLSLARASFQECWHFLCAPVSDPAWVPALGQARRLDTQ